MMMLRSGTMVVVIVTALAVVMTPICATSPLDYDDVGGALLSWPPRAGPPPSMRLRFGKRGTGLWGLTQRSMPSLRMRFGKREWPAQQESLDYEPLVRGVSPVDALRERRGGDRNNPGLRLRFGKRQDFLQQEEDSSTQQ